MAELITLPAVIRDLKVKPRDLRFARKIPAEYYGREKKNLHLALDYQTFRKIYRKAGGSTLINLLIEGESEPREILVHTVDYDPITDEFQHIDLKQIERGKKITTYVSIRFEGISPAVKTLGGILTHNKTKIEVRCLPKDLISEIVADLTKLEEITDTIRIADLPIDREKIDTLENDDVIVCTVMAPKTQDEIDSELTETTDEVVSEDVKTAAEEEKSAAQSSKESDTEKKGNKN